MDLVHQTTIYEASACSRSYILVLAALILIAMPVFGQKTQPTTGVEAAKSTESLSKSSDVSLAESSDFKPTEKEKNSRTPLAVPAKKLIAEKATLSPAGTKPASVDAGQDAPAAHEDWNPTNRSRWIVHTQPKQNHDSTEI